MPDESRLELKLLNDLTQVRPGVPDDTDAREYGASPGEAEALRSVEDVVRRLDLLRRAPPSPALAASLYEIGNLLADLGPDLTDLARRAQLLAADARPNWHLPHLALAELRRRAGDTTGALESLQLARSLAPDDTDTLVAHAALLAAVDHRAEAEAALRLLAVAEPDAETRAAAFAYLEARGVSLAGCDGEHAHGPGPGSHA